MTTNVLDELHKPYVVTARTEGLAEWKLILKYSVQLALNPPVSTPCYLLPQLVSGGIIVSIVLSLSTEGPLPLSALLAEDMFLSSAIVLLPSMLAVIGALIPDILLGIADQRIRM
jgi:peptide/nickel transport system permease protein